MPTRHARRCFWNGLTGLALVLVAGGAAAAAETVRLADLDLSSAVQGWGQPQKDKAVGGAPLTIAGRAFAHGFGTHSIGRLLVDLDGGCEAFQAWAGIDDEATPQGSVEFQVLGDDKRLWTSGIVRRGQPAKEVKVDLQGVKQLALVVTDAGDGYGNDHADWAEAVFIVTGARPRTVAPVLKDWENYRLLGINKEPAHAPLVACPDAATAKTIRRVDNEERVKSPWYRSLCRGQNGVWKFHYAQSLAHRVPDFFQPSFDDRQWPTITVPSNMELQGYGVPIYTNIPNPWSGGTPPFIPADEPNNTVGAYRGTFTVPPTWIGRPVFITFDGVCSFFYLWINGQPVGMSKESRTPAEFEITPYVHPGENRIAVEVFRWSDGSYLEDQDTWRLSGIYRDVYVWSPPPVFIRDVEVRTTLDATYRDAQLQVSAKLRNLGHQEATVRLEAELFDAEGRTVATHGASQPAKIPARENLASAFSIGVTRPQLWTAETPYRYLLLLTLKDAADQVLEVIPQRIGFRQVEIRAGQLLVNGRAILVKGVNRHEQDAEHGFAVTTASMRRDIALMKRLNINAVRTCHYPDAPAWYDLCDELGLYVVAECNIETHAVGDQLTKNPAWADAYLDRAVRNVETHKNHPSIVLWSLGNESGNGANMVANYRWIKQRDPTRPVFYDPASFDENSDIVATMYMKPWDVAKYVEKPQPKPLILCEYAYARGNASGDLWSYWKTFYQGQSAQGAFIWDFQDRAIPQPIDPDRRGRLLPVPPPQVTTSVGVVGDGTLNIQYVRESGKSFWAYGGDFGPPGTPSDGNMCCNGIVGADRQPHPGAWEVKHVYQDIHCRPVSLAERTIEVANYFTYTNLRDIATAAWRVTADGQRIQGGQLPALDLPPRQRRTVTIPVKPFTPEPGVEYHLELSFTLQQATAWAAAGHELAWDQFRLPDAAPKPVSAATDAPKLAQDGDRATVTGKGFTAVFDRGAGALVSLTYRGTELIHTPLRPHFWRAPVDNDRGYGFDNVYGIWKHATEGLRVEEMTLQTVDRVVVARAVLKLPKVDVTWETFYTVHANGDILVDARFAPNRANLPKLPRIGMQMALPKGFEKCGWFGPGPEETYSDRRAARVGVYSSTVDEQVVDYTRPSEMGNHVDVRWLALANDQSTGLLIIGQPLLSVSALHYTAADLDGPRHLYEIPRRDETWLNIDLRQLGVGGDDGWGAQPHDEFQIPCRPYRYRFLLRPFAVAHLHDVPPLARPAMPPVRPN